MKRELKFRAWDKKYKEWQTDFLISENGLNVYIGYCDDRIDCELMQYTGLKDKNGKEIFEGDILCGYGNINTDELDISSAFVVKWDKNGWEIFKESETQYYIIGNIYENENLLQ